MDEFNYLVRLPISQNEIIDNVPAQSPSVIFVFFTLFLVSALDLCRGILWFDSFTTTSLCANFIHREKHGGNWRSIAEEKYSNNEQIRITITIWNHDNDGGNGVNSTQIPCINVIWSEKWIKQLIEQPEFFFIIFGLPLNCALSGNHRRGSRIELFYCFGLYLKKTECTRQGVELESTKKFGNCNNYRMSEINKPPLHWQSKLNDYFSTFFFSRTTRNFEWIQEFRYFTQNAVAVAATAAILCLHRNADNRSWGRRLDSYYIFSFTRTHTHPFIHSQLINATFVQKDTHSHSRTHRHRHKQPNARTHNKQTDGSNSECKFPVLFFILAGWLHSLVFCKHPTYHRAYYKCIQS